MIDFSLTLLPPNQRSTPCLVLGICEEEPLSSSVQVVDKASGGIISKRMAQKDMLGKLEQTLLLYDLPNIEAERVLLLGFGKQEEMTERNFRKAMAALIETLKLLGMTEATLALGDFPLKDENNAKKIRLAISEIESGLYHFDEFKSKQEEDPPTLKHITFAVDASGQSEAQQAIYEGVAIAKGVWLTRDLGNRPANHCTPRDLEEEARKVADHYSMKFTSLDQAGLEALKAGAFLAVAQGSRQPPRLIALDYRNGPDNQAPIVLIGKGITFDSGGISIKPASGMEEMKFDMLGAASVLGALIACAELALPLNVTGILAAAENLPDGAAVKPGDVVTTSSGQTVEIVNTDAEGRLVLCDAITYSERYSPEVVIDIATLTGACIIALGIHVSALLGNHDPLVQDLLKAGKMSNDHAWELPLWEVYQEQLKSPVADMSNVGGREAGTITAACFLARFAKKLHWAHLDIAGVSTKAGEHKGATGRPVPLLAQYLINRSKV